MTLLTKCAPLACVMALVPLLRLEATLAQTNCLNHLYSVSLHPDVDGVTWGSKTESQMGTWHSDEYRA